MNNEVRLSKPRHRLLVPITDNGSSEREPRSGSAHVPDDQVYASWRLEFSELVSRLTLGRYATRQAFLIDLGAHLVWRGQSFWAFRDYSIRRWGDILGSGNQPYIAPAIGEQDSSRSAFIRWSYQKLEPSEAYGLEEVVFGTLLDILTSKSVLQHPGTLPEHPNTGSNPDMFCMAFPDKFGGGPPFSDEDLELATQASPSVHALLCLSMMASNLFFWLRFDHELKPLSHLDDEDGVLVFQPVLRPG